MTKIISIMLTAILLMTSFTLAIGAVNKADEPQVNVQVHKIEKIEKDCEIRIIYPVFSGFNLASKLNDIIQNKNTNSLGYIRQNQSYIQEMKEEQKKSGAEISNIIVSLDTNFDYNISNNILSLVMNTYEYTGGAHGSYYKESYTVNTKTDEIYTFNSLFNQKSDYKKVILNKLYTMMDQEKDLYFEDAKKTVAAMDSNFQFYIEGSDLIIYFNLYELRPYAGGMPQFTIPAKDLKGLLKDDIFSQLTSVKSLGKHRLNGKGINIPYTIVKKDDSIMVPLRYITELLGGVVLWDAKKGAVVSGGYVKDGINSYYTGQTNKSPKKLSAAPITINNRLYVPIEYFSEILNEDVSYNGSFLRIYRYISKQQRQFDNQIIDFKFPDTEKECVEMYANAVMQRKGAIQYALFSEKLRAETKASFEEMNWVTGVSSPWVTGYEIKGIGNGIFNIVFHWATSTGKADDSTVKIKVEKVHDMEHWQIIEVKE